MAVYSANTLIAAMYRKITVVAKGETPTASQLVDGLEGFNAILANLSALGVVVFANTLENFPLVIGTASYTIGEGGDFDTVRPNQVLGGYIKDGGYDYRVETIFEGPYRRLVNKTLVERPRHMFYQPEYPLGIMNLYGTPDSAYDYHFWSSKPLTEITKPFDALVLPPEYRRMFIFNLAVDMAPEYGKAIPPAVAMVARSSYRNVISLNASRKAAPADLDITYLNRGYYGRGAWEGFNE